MRYKQWGVCRWSQPSVICTIWTRCATELTTASSYKHTLCKSACQRVASLEPAVWCGAGPFHMPVATSLEEMNDQLAVLISLTMVCQHHVSFVYFITHHYYQVCFCIYHEHYLHFCTCSQFAVPMLVLLRPHLHRRHSPGQTSGSQARYE